MVLFWSGGKDCTLSLQKLSADNNIAKIELFSTLNRSNSRVSMHGIKKGLIKKQADSLGLDVSFLQLSEIESVQAYSRKVKERLESYSGKGFTHAAFGDIFLEDLRDYRISLLEDTKLQPLFPIWKNDTRQLATNFIQQGFKAKIICINRHVLDDSFAGRLYDHSLLQDLPDSVDPCGENGEFHTFVYDGPVFSYPVTYSAGESTDKTYPSPVTDGSEVGFRFVDLS